MPPGRHHHPPSPVIVTVSGRAMRRTWIVGAALAMVAFPAIALMGSGDAAGSTTLVDQQLDGIVAAGNAAPTIDPAALPLPGSKVRPRGVEPTTAIQVLNAAGATQPIAATAFATASSREIPEMVLAAYHHAADAVRAFDPGCGLPWWVLAGIGRIESGHAAGGHVDRNGTTIGRILGPRLDGSTPGTATVPDSDHGALDGDPLFDRAVGPMQLLPSTWAMVAADGNGDGHADPNNVFDASLGAARYLCAGGGRLTTDQDLVAAVMTYNQSSSYVAEVMAWGHAYRDGVMPAPDATGPIPTAPATAPASAPATGTRGTPVLRVVAAPTSPGGPAPASGTGSLSPSGDAPTTGSTSAPTSPAGMSPPTTSSAATPTTSSPGCTPPRTSQAPSSPTSDPSAPASATPTSSPTGSGGAC